MKKEDKVRKVYNEIASEFNTSRQSFENEKELASFVSLLQPGAKILDVGCGVGVPVAQYLVNHGFSVTGVDISPKLLEFARQRVPKAEFIEGDMTQLPFPEASFDGLVSLFAIFHVPREKHTTILQNFYRILRPGGILFFATGPDDWEGTEPYYGVPMFWSSYSAQKTLTLIKKAGFYVISDEIRERGKETHYWVFARK